MEVYHIHGGIVLTLTLHVGLTLAQIVIFLRIFVQYLGRRERLTPQAKDQEGLSKLFLGMDLTFCCKWI